MVTQHQVIGDRYELIEDIGRGAAADVFLGRDLRLGRLVAIKILNREAALDPAFAERFKREAKAIASLSHPNIVTVYDWGSTDETDYMVMQYVPGGNLAQLLDVRGGPLDEVEALRIGEGVASALHQAHEHGIVHRDIKPHNILLDRDRRPEVADFGIAHTPGLTHLTQTNAVVGTATYLSPEQAQGRNVDERADVYGLGVVLYELLTGRPPFRGHSMVDVAVQHIQDAPIPLRQLRPDLAPVTEQVVLTALAKDPADRYQTAGAMLTALAGARESVDAEPVAAAPKVPHAGRAGPPTVVRPVRAANAQPSRRGAGPWLIALPLLAIIALGAGLAAAHPWENPAKRPVSSGSHAPTPIPTNHTRSRHQGIASHPTPVTRKPTHASAPPATSHRAAPPHAATAPTSAAASPTSVVAAVPPIAAPAQGGASSTTMATGSPAHVVTAFYSMVSNHQFADAASLWTPSLQASDPPPVYIDQRFAATQRITVDSWTQTPMDPKTGAATVDVNLTEIDGPSSPIRHFTGSWQLQRVDGTWLLNWPDLRQTS